MRNDNDIDYQLEITTRQKFHAKNFMVVKKRTMYAKQLHTVPNSTINEKKFNRRVINIDNKEMIQQQ